MEMSTAITTNNNPKWITETEAMLQEGIPFQVEGVETLQALTVCRQLASSFHYFVQYEIPATAVFTPLAYIDPLVRS
jgi:hypothetical protein